MSTHNSILGTSRSCRLWIVRGKQQASDAILGNLIKFPGQLQCPVMGTILKMWSRGITLISIRTETWSGGINMFNCLLYRWVVSYQTILFSQDVATIAAFPTLFVALPELPRKSREFLGLTSILPPYKYTLLVILDTVPSAQITFRRT